MRRISMVAAAAACIALASCGGGGATSRDGGGTGGGAGGGHGGAGGATDGGVGHDAAAARDGGALDGPAGERPGPIGSTDGLICSKDQWCWENPLPQGNPLNSVWQSSDTDIWAVGDHGTIVHRDGKAWTAQQGIDPQISLHGVWGSAANDVWTVGRRDVPGVIDPMSVILHWNGTSWTPTTHPESLALWGISGSAANNVWTIRSTRAWRGLSLVEMRTETAVALEGCAATQGKGAPCR